MIYRRKVYKVDRERVEWFNSFFNEFLLPSQLKYGARLIGRWMTSEEKDGVIEIFAMWEYDSHEDYESIETKIRNDGEHVRRVQAKFDEVGRDFVKSIFKDIQQDFVLPTAPRHTTILKEF